MRVIAKHAHWRLITIEMSESGWGIIHPVSQRVLVVGNWHYSVLLLAAASPARHLNLQRP
jgi:hypothetical protein